MHAMDRPGSVFILFLAGTCYALLDFFVRQDLDRIFGEDVAQPGPDGGCCDEVSALSHLSVQPSKKKQ